VGSYIINYHYNKIVMVIQIGIELNNIKNIISNYI